MKKSLTAVAALASLASSAVFAQSAVNVYGAVDAALTQYNSEGASKTGLGNSQYSSAKLGFSGSKVLSSGLTTIFKLEGGLANDFGGGKASNSSNQVGGAAPSAAGGQGFLFQRYAYVGLAGTFGEVRLGRDYTAAFRAVSPADPFQTNGPADMTTMALNLGNSNKQATTSNASNMIGYYAPEMGGFNATAQVFFGENASNAVVGSNDGNGYSARVGYTKGPVAISLGTQTTTGTVSATTQGDYGTTALSVAYNLGVAKLAFTNTKETLVKSGGTASNGSNMFGVTVPFGAANLKASYIRASQNTGLTGAADTSGTMVGLGADYALDKSTIIYATYSQVTNSDGGKTYSAGNSALSSLANNSSSGLAVGVFYAF